MDCSGISLGCNVYCIFTINKQLILKLIVDIDGYATLISWSDLLCWLSPEGTFVSHQMQGSINQLGQMSSMLHNLSNYEQITWVYRDCCGALQRFLPPETWTFCITNNLKITLIKSPLLYVSVLSSVSPISCHMKTQARL